MSRQDRKRKAIVMKATFVFGAMLLVGYTSAVTIYQTGVKSQLSKNWSSEVVDETGWVGIDSCIALDANGNFHISHYDQGNRNLKYAYWDGNSWQNETVDSDGDIGEESGIAVDSDGNPHISYIDCTNCAVKYAGKIGGTWNIEEVYLSGGGNPISGTSIALDSNERPCIVFSEEPDDWVRYAYRDGDEWEIEDVCMYGEDVYLALDSGNTPHVSFLKNESQICYATRISDVWNVQVVDSSTQAGGDTGIAVDSNSHPHIAYNDYGNGAKKYAVWDGTSWNTEIIASDVGSEEGTKIAVDSQNRPHIVYSDNNSEFLKYAFWDGGSWTTETIDRMGNPSIVLGNSDKPHVSHGYTVGDDIEAETEILKYSVREAAGGNGDEEEGNGEEGSGCFIATAAYGTATTEEVKRLSEFRDEYVLTNRAGQSFVRWYYRHSPKVASFIRNRRPLKLIVRLHLKPIIWMCALLDR